MESWAPQIEAFSRRYRAISYSRRNSHPNKNALHIVRDPASRDADDLRELMQILRIDSAHLVGASYGALIALMFALRWPGLVTSLTLLEPPLHAWLERLPHGAALRDRFIHDVWNRAAMEFAKSRPKQAMRILAKAFGMAAPGDGEVQRHARLRNARAMKALVLSEQPFPMLDRTAVQTLKMPVLVVRGATTDPVHETISNELAKLPATASTAIIRKAGHRAHIDNPEAFNDVVLRFLLEVPELRSLPQIDSRRSPVT